MYDYACICIIIRFHVTIDTIFAVFAYYNRYIYWNMLEQMERLYIIKYTSEWYIPML